MHWDKAHVELRAPRRLLAPLLHPIASPRLWGARSRNFFVIPDEATEHAVCRVRAIGTHVLEADIQDQARWCEVVRDPARIPWRRIAPSAWRIIRYRSTDEPWQKTSVWYRMFDRLDASTDLFCPDEADRLEAALEASAPREVLLQQNPATPFFERLIRRLRDAGTVVKLDYDDLNFDEASLDDPWWSGVDEHYRAEYRREMGLRRRMFDLVDEVVLSTQELVDAARRYNPNCVLQPNRIPAFYRLFDEPEQGCSKLQESATTSDFRIYYGPGARWHSAYLSRVEAQLLSFLREHPSAELVLGGGLAPPKLDEALIRQVRCLPRTLPEIYFHRLRRYDVVLAPLPDGPHARAKSWIKALEAAVQGVPFIASNLPDYRRLVDAIGWGTVCEPDEWQTRLATAFADRDEQRRRSIAWAVAERERYLAA